MEAIHIVIHGLITVTAVVAVAVRIEHRLTSIETDIKWIKKNNQTESKGD